MSDEVREIKSRIDIVDIVGEYFPLRRRSGNSYTALCPFHMEKTPSFSVSQDKQMYYCFGCGAGGDVFKFLMDYENISFQEALQRLADRAGVTLADRPGERKRSGRRDPYAIMNEAARYFSTALLEDGGVAARAYLERRNLPRKTWVRFGLGWSPQSWDALSRYLAGAGYTRDEIFEAGLAKQGERGTQDQFRGRVIFEIRDDRGNIVGFSGRSIEDDSKYMKYVNSPSSDLFQKRRILYLLSAARAGIREKKRVILTEGYMDAIRCHLSGYTEAVASLGTALTEEQAVLIKRAADICYIVYDADGAGQEAAIRGMYVLQRKGVEVRVGTVPDGKDPDDLLSKAEGCERFERMLYEAMPLPRYHVHVRRKALRTPGEQQKARADVLENLATLPKLDLRDHLDDISRYFRILPHEVEAEVDRYRRSGNKKSVNYAEGISDDESVYKRREDASGRVEVDAKILDIECAFCALVWQDAATCAVLRAEEIVPFLTDEAVGGILLALLSGESSEALTARWLKLEEKVCPERIARGMAYIEANRLLEDADASEKAEQILRDLRRRGWERRYSELKGRVIAKEATEEEKKEYGELIKNLKGKKM